MFISEDLDPEALKNEANIKWKEVIGKVKYSFFFFFFSFLKNRMKLYEDKKEMFPIYYIGNMEEANIIWRQALKECIKYSMRGTSL
ncbi:hypothetical protein PFMC_01785 [Plasmodium falciparum CAMP/Malaysia]|uniref:Uncharacterized protein n=1 Tax=Plasmodium falciparum (isolate Camp / Malaysia) TaxID=5835 RepID=A0A024XC46_PLAFC|nr:hypothetical protein PFMC_01785 [Plasmodium falciparum CAMP/Malaysia]